MRKLPPEDQIVGFGEWFEGILGGTVFDVQGQIEQTDLSPVDVTGFERISFSGPGAGGANISRQEGVLQYVGRLIAWQGVAVPTLNKFAVGHNPTPRAQTKGLGKQEKARVLATAPLRALPPGSRRPSQAS